MLLEGAHSYLHVFSMGSVYSRIPATSLFPKIAKEGPAYASGEMRDVLSSATHYQWIPKTKLENSTCVETVLKLFTANKCQVFTSSLNIPGAKRCLFIFEVSSIYYQSAATAQKKVTFYIYSYINMYIVTDGAGTIFIHSSILYFKIAKTNAQKSLPPIPYSQRLAVVPT